MPTSTDPPAPAMPQSIFDDLQTLMTYDSTTGGFYDGSNVLHYLFVDSDTNGNARWTYGTSTSTVVNLRVKATSFTAAVLVNGTYQQSGAILYSGQNYKIRLERDSNGVAVANAHT